eukprot:TRINITY_DN4227_c0_g1_i1.p1 TRINITY_DN4227_c0_g1~~TRINITY_DN4227_c0_g1_i1.p1  ORF type:complete len:104 (-),score=10.59 TRINITY_DN4227_c0_g1_i1:63-347(-)
MRVINAKFPKPGQRKKEDKRAARKAANLRQKNLQAQKLVSGKRTGKSKRKKERQLRRQLKEAGSMDVVMKECSKQSKKQKIKIVQKAKVQPEVG